MSKSEYAPQSIKADSTTRVLCFGASIAQGLHDVRGGGYAQRLRTHYDVLALTNPDLPQPTVFPSLGVMGDTTATLLKRLEGEIVTRVNDKEDLIAVNLIGTNNTAVDSKGNARSEPEDYEQELSDIFDIQRKYTDHIINVDLPPVDEDRTTPLPWDSEVYFFNDRILGFNIAARGLCRVRDVVQVETFEPIMACIEAGEKMFTERDGLHPNGVTHALIAELIKPKIDELISIIPQ
jgi:lysophospholipase L1-like esterase